MGRKIVKLLLISVDVFIKIFLQQQTILPKYDYYTRAYVTVINRKYQQFLLRTRFFSIHPPIRSWNFEFKFKYKWDERQSDA